GELKAELTIIFDEVLTTESRDRRAPYYDLIEMLLTKTFVNIEVIKALPEYVLKLGEFFWLRSYEREDMYSNLDIGVGKYFGIDEGIDRYFPASAYQTPVYWLLKAELTQTINFILDFTNKSVDCFVKSSLGKNEVTTTELY